MIRSIFLAVKEVTDTYIRKNFDDLNKYFDENGQLDGFKHLEFSFTRNEANVKISHGLGVAPKDIIVTRLLAPSGAKITWNFGKFTASELDVTITGLSSGEMKVRAFVGTYKNSVAVAVNETESQESKSKL